MNFCLIFFKIDIRGLELSQNLWLVMQLLTGQYLVGDNANINPFNMKFYS